MKRRWIAVAAIGLLPVIAYHCSFRSCPLPEPAAFEGALPGAWPPAEMAVYQLPTGITRRNAGVAYRGGSFQDERSFAITATLVKHPKGDLLIDTGFGRQIDAQFHSMPRVFQWLTRYERMRPAADQLQSAGYDFGKLRAILLTHAHWDHVSGVPDFPNTPVWITRDERRFIDSGDMTTRVARDLSPVRYEQYAFEGGPYLGFSSSHDVYGDGAIVVVPAAGHTPGSVIVFLALPGGQRYALVGDLVWQREGITSREEKPWPTRTTVDDDPQGVRQSLLHMSALARRFPELILVPAHDTRGFARMSRL